MLLLHPCWPPKQKSLQFMDQNSECSHSPVGIMGKEGSRLLPSLYVFLQASLCRKPLTPGAGWILCFEDQGDLLPVEVAPPVAAERHAAVIRVMLTTLTTTGRFRLLSQDDSVPP
ncbi:hypothetical protein CapIbe_012847 [Capra ibex]